MATGSISDTPPTGPSVPPGTPLSDILDLISTSQAAYNAALLTYNNAKDTYTAFVNDANAKYLAYQQTPTQQTLDDYTAAVTALAAPTLAWQLAVVELNSASTTYVTNLAYQQIYYAQTSDSTITTALTSILGQSVPSSTPLGQRIPVFPWLSSSQIDALTAIAVTNAPATQLKTVLHNLLTAFLNYRNIYWRLASDNDSLAHLDANRTAAYHDLNLAIAGVSGYDLTDCQTAYDTAQFQYDTMHTQLTTDLGTALTLSTALNSSISAYEATYEAVKNLGTPLPALDLTVQTVIAFCANWTENVVHAAQTAVSTALQDAMNALVFANQELVANFNADYAASHPGLSPESITQILSQLAAVQAALTTAGVYLVESITTPTLPASSSSMSMMELMGILGQAELTSEEVIRRAADSEHQITAMRLQFAISHLMLFANELAALQDWSNELIKAQIDFNAQIEINNGQTYDSLVATYTTYQNNISVINGVIDQVNQEIEAENARGQALVDAANAMDPAIVSAIFSEQISVSEAPDYLLDHLTGIATTPPTPSEPLVFTPIPLFDHVTLADLPAPPYTTYPGRATLDTNLLAPFNQAITAFLVKIAPFTDLVEQALQTATSATTPPVLSNFLLESFLPVEDLMTKALMLNVSFDLLYSFLSQTTLSGISTKSQKSATEDLEEQLEQILGFFGGATGATGGIGLGGSLLASAGAFGAALSQVVNSSIFLNSIQLIVERASMLAGLQVAGSLPGILGQLTNKNMTLADLLELRGETTGEDIETQTKAELVNALIQQLALAAGTQGALSTSAIDILQNFPSLSSLSKEALGQLISGLVTMQQMVLLNIVTMLGVAMGLTPAQMATAIFGSADASTADMISRFMGLGLPQTLAIQLASQVVGYDELQIALSALGFDPTTRTMLMAIIAASQGNIPLSEGAPGGPAFLDTLLSALKDRGITMTVNINSPDFLKELYSQLSITATLQQQSVLKTYLLGYTSQPAIGPTPSPVEQAAAAIDEVSRRLQSIFTAPALPISESTPVVPVKPSAILSKYETWYSPLSPDLKSELLAAVANEPALAGITGVSSDQKAALMLAMRLGVITAPEATSLLMLVVKEAKATALGAELSLSKLETNLVTRLFTPTPEELRQREEAIRREINAPYQAPFTLPPQVLDQVSISFRKFFNNLSDQSRTTQAYEAFAKTIPWLGNFNKIFLDHIINPGYSVMRQLSPYMRTAQDRMPQSKITLTG